MRPILIAYSSTEGHSQDIARHIAQRMQAADRAYHLLDLKAAPAHINAVFDANEWAAAVVTASIHLGTYDDELFAFVKRHATDLSTCPSAFLSVSLSAASEDMAERLAIDDIAHHLFLESDWLPSRLVHVGGAVDDAKLNLLKRAALHAILHAKGITPSETGYMDFTDWAALDRFADDFMAMVDAEHAKLEAAGKLN